jgi:hypothetical protein
MRLVVVLLSVLAVHAAQKAPKKAKAQPKLQPAALVAASPVDTSIGSGLEKYTPTKCEWLAVELNSNYRISNLKNGYTLQIFCRAPGTIFLQYKYLTEADHEAALLADETIRQAIAQVARTRKWKWVKVEGDLAEVEAPEAPAPAPEPKAAAPTPARSKAPKAKKLDEEEASPEDLPPVVDEKTESMEGEPVKDEPAKDEPAKDEPAKDEPTSAF